jgi:hypothetical protein
MRKSYSTIVLILACLCGLGISARAQDIANVAVNIPFEFVAGGQTLPAGTYIISRISDQMSSALLIRSNDSSVFLFPIVFNEVPADHTELSFEHLGGKHFLIKVGTLSGAYAIRTPRPTTQVAQIKDQGAMSSSGTN